MVSRKIGFRFSLVSYNILSHKLLQDHGGLYEKCNPRDLEWPRRGHKIVSELLDNKADIICLQEVEQRHLRSLYLPKLAQSGYECLYKKKTGHKVDGCAIFFKTNLFDLQHHKGIEFKRTDLARILDRDNVGIIAVLKPKSTLKLPQLVIANTHLIFNPKRCDVRLAQLKLFLSELETMSARHDIGHDDNDENESASRNPTILCGDFNCEPNSDVVRFILQDSSSPQADLPRRTMRNIIADIVDDDVVEENAPSDSGCSSDDPGNCFKFKSVYPTHNKAGEPYVSTFDGCVVDYIFYKSRLKLESYLELLTDKQLREMDPLPNSDHPSDHVPLEARFILNLSSSD